MRSRWYHVPILHTALHEEKKVTWLELFYDLIFVAAIIQLGDALSNDVTLGNFAAFAGHFVPLWIAWSGFTFYVNRFSVDDFTHRLLVFLQMFAVGAMAIAAPDAMKGDHRIFALAFGVAQAMITLMYMRAWRSSEDARDYSRYWGIVFGLAAVFWLVSTIVPNPWCYGLWSLGVLVVIFAPLSRQSRALQERMPIDMEHLAERYGLLTIIVLGESFVKVLSFLAQQGHGAEPEYLLKGMLNLLITCCVWWIYFDDVAGSKLKRQRGAWMVWLYSHVPLAIAVTGVGVAVKKAIKFEFASPAPDAYRWLLAGTLALTFLAVAIIDSVTQRRQAELSDRTRVNVRFASAAVVLILGQAGAGMTSGMFIALITAVCVAQVVFDVMMAPMEEAAGHEPTAISTAELARDAAAGRRSAASIRPRPEDTVRKGTPAELRRDLYFWFLEGSWTRLMVSLITVYVVMNIFFAGLFLVEPDSITGSANITFSEAFFFSVQTMSTIGYGGLTPATSYGDLIVTLEAAVGLLSVALATGLIFAKVSRPQAGVLFSDVLVLTKRHGKLNLIFRVGNARGNDIVDANVTLGVLMDEISPEGHHLRRLHDLKLMRSRNPMFILSWTVIHEIDEDSPLSGIDWSAPEEYLMLLVGTITGHDGTYGQTTYERNIYEPGDIRQNERFVDVISQLEDGRLQIDYSLFHETEAE